MNITPPYPPLPRPGAMMTQTQVHRYAALLCFQLRAGGMAHENIARVMRLPTKGRSRALVAKGRRLMRECIIDTVIP